MGRLLYCVIEDEMIQKIPILEVEMMLDICNNGHMVQVLILDNQIMELKKQVKILNNKLRSKK